jgi:hypothetical protein
MVAFKEWTLICDALGRGEQSLIIRKGGIAEGRDGFRFKHADFLLFPTLFHEQVAKLKLPPSTPLPAPRACGHEVRFAAHVEWTRDVTEWSIVQALAPFHLWQKAEIEKRFLQDDQPGVSVAFVRIFAFSEPFRFPDSPKYGGCRSWIEVPEISTHITQQTVVDDATHRSREAEIQAALK